MDGSSEPSELPRINPHVTRILEQPKKANCLNRNMQKMHGESLAVVGQDKTHL